ncbi:hypothetical protein HAX54_001559 [Datura stramonium]|uniref:Uncharacterized protein n=1 Tax=Datura stramonium TaxID=4076 RepID=A0ABS8T3B2_DATST|nr:hypothetical protein [Datura stramonium]
MKDVMTEDEDYACYYEMLIVNNESLEDFIVTSDIIAPQIDVPLSRYGHRCTKLVKKFDVENYHYYNFGDGVGTSRSPYILVIPRIYEILGRVEVHAQGNEEFDNFDSNSLNYTYQSDEMVDSGDNDENNQQGVEDVQ